MSRDRAEGEIQGEGAVPVEKTSSSAGSQCTFLLIEVILGGKREAEKTHKDTHSV